MASPRFYLASMSPRRKDLLDQIGAPFTVLPLRSHPPRGPEVDETQREGEVPADYVLRIARDKAELGAKVLSLRGLPRAFLRPAIIGGVFAYGISQLLWITVLRVVDLSLAYPLQIGLNFILIMFVAWWYFREPLAAVKLVGIGLIFAGILTVATG